MVNLLFTQTVCHAPRERVSWNVIGRCAVHKPLVTLHVSVWVEILAFVAFDHCVISHAPRERVSWNTFVFPPKSKQSWSRSTWACELKYRGYDRGNGRVLSRSTWACELKFVQAVSQTWTCLVTLHVSVWVEIKLTEYRVQQLESRSTWACELKCIKFIHHTNTPPSRSTWACELKC